MLRRLSVLVVVALALAGCRGGQDDRPAPLGSPTPTITQAPPFDPEREPALAVLTLVPASATTLTVTDFDEIRVQLGVPDLTSTDPMAERFDFWERASTEAALLTEGLLRADNSELMLDYGFTQDDVDWEAHFTGPEGHGYVLAFRPDLDLGPVAMAVRAGAGPLDGARVVAADHLVVSGTAEPDEEVWAMDPTWHGLVGQPAASTYARQGCLPLEDVLGPDAGYDEQQAVLRQHPIASLDDLPGFVVGFGDHLATVRMEVNRDDLFARLDLGRNWPMPGFADAYRTGVGDPATGRIGYDVPRPGEAARLALLEELPFGVCPDVTPIPEPTGL